MDSNAALNTLMTNPSHFLKYYPVKCAGAPAPAQNAANLALYHLKRHGLGHRGATRPGLLGYRRAIASFKLERFHGPGSAVINHAHVVPMVNYDTDLYGCLDLHRAIGNMPHYVLDGTGDGLMVTGELSNCCFCWLPQGNDLWCIHVQPVGIDPVRMHNAIALQGRFGAAAGSPLGTFGRNDYPGGRASVLGVRRDGQWKLYAQTTNDSFATLSGAFKIYPGEKRAL